MIMSPLKLIYSNLYNDFKKRGNEEKARINGTIISTILIFLLLFAGFLLLIIYYPDFEQKSTNFLVRLFDDKLVIKGISKMFLIASFGIIYILVKYTIGTEASYNKIIEEFYLLPPEQQKGIKKRATPYFMTPIILFVVTMILLMNK